MNTVVTLKQPAHADGDPTLIVIEKYRTSLRVWQAADRRVKRLRKTLSEELMRKPRVQVSWLLRGKDRNGGDIREPIYAHSEWEIGECARRDCETMLSIHAPLYCWIADPTAKGSVRKSINKKSKAQRKAIRARYRAWQKDKMAAFTADKAGLYERQRAAGWRQAVETEAAARDAVWRLRYQLQEVTPTTIAGALAMLDSIYAAHRSKSSSGSDRSPYGLGPYSAARIARHASAFLRANAVGRKLTRAA